MVALVVAIPLPPRYRARRLNGADRPRAARFPNPACPAGQSSRLNGVRAGGAVASLSPQHPTLSPSAQGFSRQRGLSTVLVEYGREVPASARVRVVGIRVRFVLCRNREIPGEVRLEPRRWFGVRSRIRLLLRPGRMRLSVRVRRRRRTRRRMLSQGRMPLRSGVARLAGVRVRRRMLSRGLTRRSVRGRRVRRGVSGRGRLSVSRVPG